MEENLSRPITINITTGAIIKSLAWIALAILLYVIRDIVLIFLTSVVIASSVEPAAKFFARYRVPRVVSVLSVYIIFFSVLFLAFYVFLPILSEEMNTAQSFIPQQIGTISPNFAPAADAISFFTGSLASDISLRDIFSGGSLTVKFFKLIGSTFNGLVSFIMIIVISFYLAVQKNGIENLLRVVAPLKQEPYIIGLWKRTERKIGGWAQGQLLLGLIIGPLVYVGLALLQVKYALTLALVAALFELIPVFGPVLAAVPAVLIGFSMGGPIGLMVLGFYLIIHQFENHLIYPLVVNKILGVSPILVIVSIIVGAKLAGFLGIILAVPAAAMIMEVVGDIERRKLSSQSAGAGVMGM